MNRILIGKHWFPSNLHFDNLSFLISIEKLVIKLLTSHREIQNFGMEMKEGLFTFNIR